MKVILRLKAALAHPSWIARCFKDKFYIPIIFFITFLGIYAGVSALMIYHSTYITRDDSVTVSEKLALNSLKNTTINYEDYKMSGTKAVVNYNDTFKIYFNVEPASDNLSSEYFTLYFLENEAKGYTGKSLTFTKSYNELNYDFKFNLENIVKGESKDRIQFIDFLDSFMVKFERNYENQTMIGAVMLIGEFMFILFLVMFIFTYLLNPTIRFGVRAKLMLYDSIIFIFIFTLSVAFNARFLQYVAAIISVFYSNITFRHIIRKGDIK